MQQILTNFANLRDERTHLAVPVLTIFQWKVSRVKRGGRVTNHELDVLEDIRQWLKCTSSKSIWIDDGASISKEHLHVGRVVCAFREFLGSFVMFRKSWSESSVHFGLMTFGEPRSNCREDPPNQSQTWIPSAGGF